MHVNNTILVIDVETSGFDPSKHACIELGAVLLDYSLNIVEEFSSLIAPWKGAEFFAPSMMVNKISSTELTDAPAIEQVVTRFCDTFFQYEGTPLLAGWNVWFDVNFVRNLFDRTNRQWPFGYRLLDVQSIVCFHAHFAKLSQQDAVSQMLKDTQTHRALADARHTSRLLQYVAGYYFQDDGRASTNQWNPSLEGD